MVDVHPHLTNPYRLPDFHDLSGLDTPTRDFVLGQPAAQKLLSAAAVELNELLATGVLAVRVRVGCTGGKDRSVEVVAEFAARIFQQADRSEVVLRHLHVHLRAGADRRAQP